MIIENTWGKKKDFTVKVKVMCMNEIDSVGDAKHKKHYRRATFAAITPLFSASNNVEKYVYLLINIMITSVFY